MEACWGSLEECLNFGGCLEECLDFGGCLEKYLDFGGCLEKDIEGFQYNHHGQQDLHHCWNMMETKPIIIEL